MRYMGGKHRIAKRLVEAIRERVVLAGTRVWEPFCGGLSMTRRLSEAGALVLASDANPALVCTYAAVRAGWDPPLELSQERWREAKALPDTDPLKAFAGFGVSFGGNWFSSYAQCSRNYAAECRRALLRDVPLAAGFAHYDFNAVEPFTPPWELVLYCDPPYLGTASYADVGAFDHAKFWQRCREWVNAGAHVFVSEYRAPVDWPCILEVPHKNTIARKKVTDGSNRVTDRLFYRGPVAAAARLSA